MEVNECGSAISDLSASFSAGTSDIKFQLPLDLVPKQAAADQTVTHAPNGQLAYLDGRTSHVLLEVGYSSKGKERKAKNLSGIKTM